MKIKSFHIEISISKTNAQTDKLLINDHLNNSFFFSFALKCSLFRELYIIEKNLYSLTRDSNEHNTTKCDRAIDNSRRIPMLAFKLTNGWNHRTNGKFVVFFFVSKNKKWQIHWHFKYRIQQKIQRTEQNIFIYKKNPEVSVSDNQLCVEMSAHKSKFLIEWNSHTRLSLCLCTWRNHKMKN